MLRSGNKLKTPEKLMILNNYLAMKHIKEIIDKDI